MSQATYLASRCLTTEDVIGNNGRIQFSIGGTAGKPTLLLVAGVNVYAQRQEHFTQLVADAVEADTAGQEADCGASVTSVMAERTRETINKLIRLAPARSLRIEYVAVTGRGNKANNRRFERIETRVM